QCNQLKVTPYLDGIPIGEARATDVLWHEYCLLVRERSPAKYTDALVRELSRTFGADKFADAIRTCVDRDPEFVEEYLSEVFELRPLNEIERPAPPPVAAQSTSTATPDPLQEPPP